MNIKALLLTGLLTVGSASPALALAYPGQGGGSRVGNDVPQSQVCHFDETGKEYWMSSDRWGCDVTSRTNNNGHKVWDITVGDWKTSVVLWNDGKAEFFQKGDDGQYIRMFGTWTRGDDGRIEVYQTGHSFSFAFPTR